MNYLNFFLAAALLFAAVSATPVKKDSAKEEDHHKGSPLPPLVHGKNETSGHKNVTTPAPALNGTTPAPHLNGSTPLPALNGSTIAPALNGSTELPSLNGTTEAPGVNGTTELPEMNATTLAPVSRIKRDCKSADLTKIESKLSLLLEQEFEKLLNSTETPVLTNGHQGAPGAPSGAPGGAPGGALGGAGGDLPPPTGLAGEPETVTAQKVAAIANKNNGSAVAQALAKRSVISQNVSADAHNAVGTAEIHNSSDNNVQKVETAGNNTGISTALIDNKNATHGLNMQDVGSTGTHAASAATITKLAGNSLQNVVAVGGESSVASSSAGAQAAKPDHKRAACTPLKLDDNMRLLIHNAVVKAIDDLKNEL